MSSFRQYYNCTICKLVVEDPKECTDCNKLTCKKCINQWKLKNDTCPGCKCNINIDKNVNRLVMDSLNKTAFVCDQCSKSFKYETRRQHWDSCEVFQCKMKNCHYKGSTFSSLEELEAHWVDQCNAIPLKCNVCEAYSKRQEVGDHRCEIILL